MPGHPNATAGTLAGAAAVVLMLIGRAAGVEFTGPEAELYGGALSTLVAGVVLFVGRRRAK